MKRFFTHTIAAASAAILLCTSCIKDNMPASGQDETPTGQLGQFGQLDLRTLAIEFEKALDITSSTTSTVRSTQIDVTGFTVQVLDRNGAIAGDWTYGTMPETVDLPAGTYTLEVLSGPVPDAAWEMPCYGARRTVTIEPGQATGAGTMTCSLQNIMVTVNFNELIMTEAAPDAHVVITVGNSSLRFTRDEIRTGYFRADAEQNIISAEFSATIDGRLIARTDVFERVQAGQHRILNYELVRYIAPEGQAGFDFSVDLNCQVIDVNHNILLSEETITDPDAPQGGDGPGPDQPEQKDPPSIEWQGGDIDTPYTLTSTDTTQVKIPIRILCPAGISGFTVDIISEAPAFSREALLELGLDTHLDFVSPGSMKEGLESLDFKTGEQLVGQTEMMFNITTFVPMLVVANNYTVDFRLTITDSLGRTAQKTLMLEIKL